MTLYRVVREWCNIWPRTELLYVGYSRTSAEAAEFAGSAWDFEPGAGAWGSWRYHRTKLTTREIAEAIPNEEGDQIDKGALS